MPQPVDLGAPYGIVAFPDEYTPEQIVGEYNRLEEKRARDIRRLKLTNANLADISAGQQESRIPESIALGVESGKAAVPIYAGHILQALAPTRSEIEAGGQVAPEGFTDEVIQPGFGGFPVGVGLNAPTVRTFGRMLVGSGVERQKAIREEAEQLGGGIPGTIARSLSETATVSAQTLPFAALGMGPVAIAAGLQQYGLQKEQFKQQVQEMYPKLSDEEAYRIADGPAAVTGAVTGALTRVFGGTERLIGKIVEGRLKVEGVKALLREANLAGATELPEEYLDQLSQGFIEKAYINPDKPVSEIFNEAAMAGLTGYALGVGHGAAIQTPIAAAARVEEAVQGSRLRRESRDQSRDQSRERIARIVAQREREGYAEGTGAEAQARGQEAGIREGEVGGVRVRSPAENRVEAQPGAPTPVIPAAEPAPAITPEPVAVPPPEAPTAQVAPPTPAQQVVSQAIADIFVTPEGSQEASPAPAAVPIPQPRLRQIVGEVAANWQNAPEVIIVDTVDQLPEAIQRRAATVGLNRVAATAFAGKVYLVSGNITDEAVARRLLFHETIGHIGVQAVFPSQQQFANFMRGVAARHAKTQLGQEIRANYGNDPMLVGEEILAKIAENPQIDPTLWQQIVAAVRTWARRVFNVNISDNDIRVLLRRGRRAVEGGRVGTIGRTRYFLESGGGVLRAKNATVIGPAMFAITAHHGTGHVVDRFSTEKIGSGAGSQVYGWGLYFAENAEVAENYARSLGGGLDLIIDGVKRSDLQPVQQPQDNPESYAAWEIAVTKNADRAILALEAAAKQQVWNEDERRGFTDAVAFAKRLRNSSVEAVIRGNQYTVSINGSKEEFLDWDKPLTEQSDTVKRALESNGITITPSGSRGGSPVVIATGGPFKSPTTISPATGEEFYHQLSASIGFSDIQKGSSSNQAATGILDFFGIKGITYLDQGSRGLGDVMIDGKPYYANPNRFNHNTYEGQASVMAKAWLDGGQTTEGAVAWIRANMPSNAIQSNGYRSVEWSNFSRAIESLLEDNPRFEIPQKTYNYAVFNDADITITHENGQPVPVQEAMSQDPRFALTDQPSFFETRGQVTAAQQGLPPSQVQESEDLAAVQANMVTPEMVDWLSSTAAQKNKVEIRAKKILDYLLQRAHLSDTPRNLGSLPEGTTEEQRTKELAGAMQLAHHAVDRSVASKIYRDLDVLQKLMEEAVAKTAKTTKEQHKANYLTALFNNLTSDYKQYLINLNARSPAAANIQAQFRERINRAQERLNSYEQSPTALKNALSAIARTIPEGLLTPTIEIPEGGGVPSDLMDLSSFNQQVIDWVLANGALNGVVSDDIQNWLLVDDGTGQPGLMSYERLLPDLAALKDILTKENATQSDIEAFQAWFKNAATGKKVSAREFAQKYFAFRTGRDRAVKIIAATEAEVDSLDERIRANVMARDRLETMMNDPAYKEAVRAAAAEADIVVRSLYDPNNPEAPAVGLIDRDRAVGTWRLKGPMTGTDYIVDLHPSSAGEAKNREELSAWTAEARQWADENRDIHPLLADEYDRLADYIDRHFMSPSFDPKRGFTQTRVRIPGTTIRVPIDPYDLITSATQGIGFSFQTIRDVMERIGGRTMKQAFADAATLDTVMRRVESIDANKDYGRAAQTLAVLRAINSHGWTADQIKRWDEQIAEPVIASAQNRLSRSYEVGDTIVGSGVQLTAADMAAIKLMKQWGDALISAAPHSIQDRLADLGISRKAIGNGRLAGHRISANWTRSFVDSWNGTKTDAEKLSLLSGDEEFRRVVLGYMAEYNPEFQKMNPASPDRSPLMHLYRRLSETEKRGVLTFRSWGNVVAFLASEMVSRNMAPDIVTATETVQRTLLQEIKDFIGDFEKNVLNKKSTEVWGGVPDSDVQIISTRNAFTTPRGKLQAPSTFYTYSTATAARQQQHTGSLRSLLNLKLLQSGAEATAALETKRKEISDRIEAVMKTGVPRSKAQGMVKRDVARQKLLGELRFDYREILTALRSIEKSFGEVGRYERSTPDHYEHAGVAAANNFFSSIKSFLLSSTQALSTNFWNGSIMGPALAHWQAGQFGKAFGDLAVQPALMSKVLLQRISAMVEKNPLMSKLLKQHAPLWDELAQAIINASIDWRSIQGVAQSSGMVNPYNLRKVLRAQRLLRKSGGRLINDDPHAIAEAVNYAMGAPVVRHVTETTKAFAPRTFDNIINYMLVENFGRDMDSLKNLGWASLSAREAAAAGTGRNWKDLTQPENVLTPKELGLKTHKALEWYQQLFSPLGSLDAVLLDYYDRTKGMNPEDRENEPLLNPDDHAALALQYAAQSNVSTETNRPGSFKGKGSEGVARNIAGTFLGWGVNMMHRFSKGLQTHSADKNRTAIWNAMIGIGTIILMLAASGAWNWEFGDELTKLAYNVSSARVQPGNIKDPETALLYLFQALVNTVPVVGSMLGNAAGVAYTGRGNPLDLTSLSPQVGFLAGMYNTAKRTIQTGDASLPLLDFVRNWVPGSKIVLNRLPIVRGIVDQQNSIRSLNASAPPGTEIKWGKRGGDAKYGPANDEVTKLIAAAYEAAAHGGDMAAVQSRMQDAIAAYVRAGRSPEDAAKALASALSSKEPIRVLTGREVTPEEEARWVARMTSSQKADYARATAAWQILSSVTGRDLNMVSQRGASGGGRGGRIPSRAIGLPSGGRRGGGASLSAPSSSLAPVGYAVRTGGGVRVRRPGTRRRSSSRLRARGTTRRRQGPRLGGTRRRTTRRRGLLA